MVLPQMIWGRPKIKLYLDEFNSENKDKKIFFCHVNNQPIKNKFLIFMGVYRNDARGILPYLKIKDAHTNSEIYHDVNIDIGLPNRKIYKAVDLVPSEISAAFAIITIYSKTGQVKASDDKTEICIGEYIVDMGIFYQSNTIKIARKLSVINMPPYVVWSECEKDKEN